jgi:hypothetical protein
VHGFELLLRSGAFTCYCSSTSVLVNRVERHVAVNYRDAFAEPSTRFGERFL